MQQCKSVVALVVVGVFVASAPGQAVPVRILVPPIPDLAFVYPERPLAVPVPPRTPVDDLVGRAVDEMPQPSRKPRVEAMRKAFSRALERGWRYSGMVDHVAVRVPRPPGSVPARSLRPVALLQEWYSDSHAEVTVWGWDDGDPATEEGTIYLFSRDTGEEFYLDIQHFAASETEGWTTWGALIDYRGGWTYGSDPDDRQRYAHLVGVEFGRQVELRPARLQLGGPDARISAYSRQRCLDACLNRKMDKVFDAARTAAMSSFIACTRQPATRAGFVLYVTCIGGGSLGGFAFALANEFVFSTSCSDAC